MKLLKNILYILGEMTMGFLTFALFVGVFGVMAWAVLNMPSHL